MKKITALVLVICMLVTTLAQSTSAVVSSSAYPSIPDGKTQVAPFNYAFLPASPQWMDLVAFEEPATLHATYKLADNVLALNENQDVAKSIASAGQLISGSNVQKLLPNKIIANGGYISAKILDAAAANAGGLIKNGTVVVDETTGTAFKVVSPTTYSGVYDADESLKNTVKPLEGTYSITQPMLSEVIKDFELPNQTVSLTRGNITDFAPNIEGSVVNPSNYKMLSNDKDFKHLSDNPLIALKFDNVELDADLGDGLKIKVNVSGGLGIDSMDLTGYYTGFKGYGIAMTLDQECTLDVTLDIEIKQEIRIPLYGFDVGFGVGRISGGVFAILGMDGTLRLEIESDTYVSVSQGVEGGTFAYVPTSAKPIFQQKLNVDGDVALSGQIDGYIKFGPMVKLELFGFDLVGAGIFLGAGVHVGLTLKTLDIELYAIFNVYITIVGETFNLANYKPTIFRRQQADTGGYRVKFLEAFVKPGRVGGTIEVEPDDPENEEGYIPAANLPYRILVVPKGVSFDPNYPETADTQADIRKYPDGDWAVTNDEGEYIQMDGSIIMNSSGEFVQTGDNAASSDDNFFLNMSDTAYLEFKANGTSYLSDPIHPKLPFSNVTLTKADYFNDFVMGQVQPIRVLNWEATKNDPPENQYMWAYYKNGIAKVSPKQWDAWGDGWTYGGMATCWTDDYGNFDTRWQFIGNGLGSIFMMNKIDVRPTDGANIVFEDIVVSLVDHEAVFNKTIPVNPTMDFAFDRIVTPIEKSYKRTVADDYIINEMAYDEHIWIINPNGTRTVTEDEFSYSAWGFSTADFSYRSDDKAISDAIAALSGNNKWSTPPCIVSPQGDAVLTPVLDINGNETGTALFSQRVNVRWVWQEHPNPVTITSDDHTETTTAGGSFKVLATGYSPFAFSLKGAPAGVVIDSASGIITIPAGFAEQTYTFVVRAEENRTSIIPINMTQPDHYQGNDPSPPDEQKFTLTVAGSTPTPSPSVTPTPSPTATPTPLPTATPTPPPTATPTPSPTATPTQSPTAEPTPPPTAEPVRIAPTINSARHRYQFTMTTNEQLSVPITAAGNTPITWSLEQTNTRYQIPSQVTIEPRTGVLSVIKGIERGTYYFTIKASNDVGSDTQDCMLSVTALINPIRRISFFDQPEKVPGITRLAVSSGSNGLQKTPEILAPSVSLMMPPNTLTIVNDHILDVYTNDQYTVDGTSYIRWDDMISITVENITLHKTIRDNAPVCEKYHYMDPIIIPDSLKTAIQNSFKDLVTTYQDTLILPGGNIDTKSLLEEIGNFTDMSGGGGDTYLEFGTLVEQMKSQSGGKFEVGLDEDSGMMIPGAYFLGLKDNKGSSLSFLQNGMNITFNGKNVITSENTEFDLYNFAFQAGAPHEKDILMAIGGGGENFTFGFAYHGQLPGTAEFAVTTNIAEGAQVNVFRFDAATSGFTMIAKGLTVGSGGVVTYKNDTMSEYLVTTQTIPSAVVSEMVGEQGPVSNGGNTWLFAGIGFVMILSLLVVWIILRRRKRTNPATLI